MLNGVVWFVAAWQRVDTGVRQGDEVSIYYDPMIAKLIVWGEDRAQALQRLAVALTQYRIAGLTTNIDFLYNLATSEPFAQADLDTGFIQKHRALLFLNPSIDDHEAVALAALYLLLAQANQAQKRRLLIGPKTMATFQAPP